MSNSDLLLWTLEAAVPLWIERVRGWTPDARVARARRVPDVLGAKGDVLQFGSKKKGEAAAVFNELALGLACGAYQPGGITFCGRTWCAAPPRRKKPPPPPPKKRKARRKKK